MDYEPGPPKLSVNHEVDQNATRLWFRLPEMPVLIFIVSSELLGSRPTPNTYPDTHLFHRSYPSGVAGKRGWTPAANGDPALQ